MGIRLSENGKIAPGKIRVFQIQYADRFDFAVLEAGQEDRVFDCCVWSDVVPLNVEIQVQRTDGDGDIEYMVKNHDGKALIRRLTSEHCVPPPPMTYMDL